MVAAGSKLLSGVGTAKGCPVRQQGGAPSYRGPVLALQQRSSAVRAAILEESATSPESQWFTPGDNFHFVGEPSLRAQQLENSFWHHPVLEVPATRDEAVVLMERLQQETAVLGTSSGVNVVAFTGGNGPALTAYLLNCVFDGAVVACIGKGPKVSAAQLEHAEYVTELLGIDLLEADDELWSQMELPEAITADVDDICENLTESTCAQAGMVIFSGAAADDLADSRTCSKMQGMKAPLAGVSRATVNALSKAVGLPVWSPAKDAPPSEQLLAA